MNPITWQRLPPAPYNVVACIPIRNEAERIISCLQSFASQDYDAPFDLLLLLNNCTDRTGEAVRAFAGPPAMRLHVHERVFPAHQANAGYARHIAMQAARQLAGPCGVLLCTDADATVPPDWIRRNILAITQGADAVAGRIEMDNDDFRKLPDRLHEDEASAQLLTSLLDAIDCIIDPDPLDTWPRHAEHSGASIAVTCAAHDAAGGIPAIPCAEDRAFFAALRRIDARIRHAPDVLVTVSGRLEGRAEGGMADTLRRRLVRPDEWLDDCIEPAADRLRRATIRSRLRSIRDAALRNGTPWQDTDELAGALGLPFAVVAQFTQAGAFGAAWQALETHSPVLRRGLVRATRVPTEIASARRILAQRRKIGNAIAAVALHSTSWSVNRRGVPAPIGALGH